MTDDTATGVGRLHCKQANGAKRKSPGKLPQEAGFQNCAHIIWSTNLIMH